MEDYSLQCRRRVERFALSVPARIEAKESREISWDEISRLLSVSHCGAGFEIKHRVKIGQLILLTAPLPQKLRCYDYSEHQYKIWGIVRHCQPAQAKADSFHVGVAFVGKYAPLSYHRNPGKLYKLTTFTKEGFSELTEAPEEFSQEESVEEKPIEFTERKYPRYQIPMEVFLETLNHESRATNYETTVSENVSLYGASVFTGLDSQPGDLVKVSFTNFNVSIVAKVCHRRVGEDGITRLHLEFIDRALPLEGIG